MNPLETWWACIPTSVENLYQYRFMPNFNSKLLIKITVITEIVIILVLFLSSYIVPCIGEVSKNMLTYVGLAY